MQRIDLTALSDNELAQLSFSIHKEKEYRVMSRIHKYPVPQLTGQKLADIKAYYEANKHTGISLAMAKWIVEYHMRNKT